MNAKSTSSGFWAETDQSTNQGFSIDFKRIGYRALRYWYLVLGVLALSVAIAWYNTRYATKIHTVTASIIIREREELSGAELLYKNAIVDPYRNYLNEPYILKSLPLIQRVVSKYDFNVSFIEEGYVVSSEVYDQLGLQVKFEGGLESSAFGFMIIDTSRYQIETGKEENVQKFLFRFNELASVNGVDFTIRITSPTQVIKSIERKYILIFRPANAVANSYASRLQVSWAEQGAGVMNLSMAGPNPKKDIAFLKALIEEYQTFDLEKKNLAADRTIVFINAQLVQISDSLRSVATRLQLYTSRQPYQEGQAETALLFERLTELEEQKLELDLRNKYYDYVQDYLSKADTLNQVLLPAAMGINDPILSDLISKMIGLQGKIQLYQNPENPENPLFQNSLRQVKRAQQDILEGIRSQRSTDSIRKNSLLNQITVLERQLRTLPITEQEKLEIRRNYSLLENLYVFLLQKRSEAAISRASNTSDISPVNSPIMGGAVSPKPFQNYLISILIGLMVPFIGFLLLELINNRVQSREDVEKFTTIPFVGGVGHNDTSLSLVVKGKPKSGISESFRAMRSNLNFFVQNQTGKVFMITSSISGEGKTFTTINLATVFALSGRKTLIVGADMRRPKIFSDFGLSNEKGLSTYLSGMHGLTDIVQPTEIDNLFLVSGGPVPPNPSELLMTEKLATFKKEALQAFDYVIFDTPPLALVTDAFVISNQVDHTVFVVRQNYTPRDFLRSIQEYYAEGKLTNMSILLNDIVKSGLGYGYGYGYQYGYAYQYGYGIRKRKNGAGYYEE